MTRFLIRALSGIAFFLLLLAASPVWTAEKRVPEDRAEISLSFAPLVKSAAPAVVNIYTETVVTARRRTPMLFDDPFFRRFFGEDFGAQFGRPKARKQNSLGSGVIVSPKGLIVSNRHVIQGADQIRVVLSDRREFPAKTLVTDAKTDLAILQIDPGQGKLPFLELGDSDELEVGDLVLAIGNPFGVGQTVTNGIVSALARTQVGKSGLNAFIQTDAAINPGNSGGALIAMDGRLIGVNTAIFSKSGGSHGIGFAVPSNMVRAVVRGVSASGELVRPWFGAAGQAVSQDIANSLGLTRPAGVLISAVHRIGAASRAGIEVGDVVLALNGHEVNDLTSLRHRVATLPVGDTAAVRVWRGGRTRAVKLQLMPAPADPPPNRTELSGEQPLAGATVANLSPAFADELSIDPFQEGVMIIKIVRGTPANRLRFRTGDIVRTVNAKEIDRVRTLTDELTRTVDRWRVVVLRNGRPRELVIDR